MFSIKHVGVAPTLSAVVLFDILAFSMLSFSNGAFDYKALLLGASLLVLLFVEYMLTVWISPHADRLLFVLMAFLLSVGMVMQYRMEPEGAAHQFLLTAAAGTAYVAFMLLMKRPSIVRVLSVPAALAGLGILAALLFVGSESGGAKNWISIGGALFQPSEFVKIALIIVLSDAMSTHKDIRGLVPAGLFTVAVICLLVFQRDLGAALLAALVFIIMFFSATGKLGWTLAGCAIGCGGAYAGYRLFDHVRIRVSAWLDPWATYSTSGYQIAQGLMAIASGGMWGMGLGLGSPSLIPAYRTDYVFAVICEEFGIIFGIGIIAVYLMMVVRGVIAALSAGDGFVTLCAFGSAALIAVQTFIIIGGVIKLIPLTGITLPFVSYGGSSMIACMSLAGIMQGAAAYGGRKLENELAMEEEKV